MYLKTHKEATCTGATPAARRDLFLLLRRLSPQAKDLCGKLSNNDNITLSPAYGGRKKRNRESGQLIRPNANSFFEKRVTGKHTKKEFGRTCRGKSGFPSVPQGTGSRCPCEPFTPLGKTDRLSRSCFAEVVIRGARAANRSESSIKK